MARNEVARVAVLGAGPIGLEAVLYARTLGLQVTVYERGRVGEYLRRWGHIRLFTPFGMNVTPLGRKSILKDNPKHSLPADGDCISGKEHLVAYLEPLAKAGALAESIRAETQVLHIGRRGFLKHEAPGDARRGQQPFRLLVREKNRERVDEADVVLDCTGTYGQHRWMGDGGIPAIGEVGAEAQIAYGLEDVLGDRRTAYAGKNIIVIGAGLSAATTVCNLAVLAEKSPDTWIVWLARGASTQPIKRVANDSLRDRDRLAVRANTFATRGEGNVEFHAQTTVEMVETAGPDKGFRVTTRCAGKPRTWDVDRLIANVGYTPDTAIYRELQVHECYASLAPMSVASALTAGGADHSKSNASAAATLRNPEPNFYILGAKSYGRNALFLMRSGFDQVREAFRLVTGKADLDLYR